MMLSNNKNNTSTQNKNRTLTTLLGVCICILVAGCAPRPDPDNATELARVFGECSFNLNTRALGLTALPEDDERVVIINELVESLTRSRYEQFPWQIHTTVFDHPVPNAFTTGGGFLAAFAGVYAMAENEAALAGVIAHELAHMAKNDPLENAGYLEYLLALRLSDTGNDNLEPGQAVKTLVDFCLAIPGLVSPRWKQDLNEAINTDTDPQFNNRQIPYTGFTFSGSPQSPYSQEQRDPLNQNPISSCNDPDRDTFNEYIVINPDYYLENYPDSDSLPPIPDDLQSGISTLPGADLLWKTDPWLQFQQMAFARYMECQSDEAGMLNLLASHYNPLALNTAFASVLNLFGDEESAVDWRFYNHPSLNQRMEDNTRFFTNNPDRLPSLEELQQSNSIYADYQLFADEPEQLTQLRDAARNELSVPGTTAHADYEPVQPVDIALMLIEEQNRLADMVQATALSEEDARCRAFSSVYQKITGQSPSDCRL